VPPAATPSGTMSETDTHPYSGSTSQKAPMTDAHERRNAWQRLARWQLPPGRVPRWLRGVRARLVAAYLVTAAVLAVGGVLLLTISLRHGLQANVDAGLQTRASALAADITAGNIDHVDPAPTIATSSSQALDVTTFTAVITPAGGLVDAQPSRLPASPVIGRPTAERRLVSAAFGGAPFRILTIPVHRADGVWLVVAGQSLEAANETNAQIRLALTVATPILLVLVGLGAWVLSGAALRPVDRMRADVQRLSDISGHARITEPDTGDGLDRLAKTFNQLLDRLHHSLDQQRALVADAGHELRTPLAVLRTELETAVRPTRTRDDLIDSIEHAQVEVARLAELAENLLLLAQADAGRTLVVHEYAEIGEIVGAALAAHRARADARSITIDVHDVEPVLADIDLVALRRILDNLLANAVRHAPDNGHIWLMAKAAGEPAPTTLHVEVRDDGAGFPTDYLGRAFGRFSRPDQGRSRAGSSNGTGLGLAVVKSLAEAMGGRASATNRPDGGAIVRIELPIRAEG
jgi:two-component system, OmpR family, sensor kinase